MKFSKCIKKYGNIHCHQKEPQEHLIHDYIDNVYDNLDLKPEHKEKVKKILHPLFFEVSQKPNTFSIPKDIQEKAKLTEASSKFYKTGDSNYVDNYLKNNNVDYAVDYSLSTPDGLVVVDNKGNAKIVLRGTELTNKKDWVENAEYFFNPETNTEYHKRIEELYSNADKVYNVDETIGFSKGGHGAIHLADKHKIKSTTFNPAITMSNIRKRGRGKHNIYNTNEDLVSALAHPFSVNPNVTLNTINTSVGSVNPFWSHHIDNFSQDLDRKRGTTEFATSRYVDLSKQHAELILAEEAKNFVTKGYTFSNFIESFSPADIDIRDNTLSKRIQRNGIEQKVWREAGGDFTRSEQFHLTNAPESTTDYATSRTQRIDHMEAPKIVQNKNKQFLVDSAAEIENQIGNTVKQKSVISHGAETLGFTPKGLGIIGASLGAGQLTKKVFPQAPEEVEAGVMGAVGGALTGAAILPEASATIGALEVSKAAGDIAGKLASNFTDDKEVIEHSKILTEGLTGGASFSILQSVASGLYSIGMGLETSVPLPQAKLVGAMAIAGAGLAEAINAFSS